MSTKKFTGAGLAIGAATAVTAMLLGSTVASATVSGAESAFGISASGLVDIAETPSVESTDGSFQEDSLLDLGIEELGLTAKVLKVTAQDGAADSKVVDLVIEDILSADLIHTSCADGDGGLRIVNLSLADGAFDLRIPQNGLIKNQEIDISPLVKVTLGEQTRNTDGTITVTGIKVTALPVTEPELDDLVDDEDRAMLAGLTGADLTGAADMGDVLDDLGRGTGEALQTITIGSATCDERDDDGGNPDDGDNGDNPGDDGKDDDGTDDDGKDDDGTGDDGKDDDGDDGGSGDDGDDVESAPAPTIVDASLSVTG